MDIFRGARDLIGVAVFALLAVFSFSARATQSVILAWDANTDSQTVGYFLYAADGVGNPLSKSDVGNNASATVNGLVEGSTYAFHLTAYNAAGTESDPSNLVNYVTPILNAAPSADGKNLQMLQGQILPVVLSGSDPNGDPITFAIATGPTHGSLSGAAPNLNYSPAAGYFGVDSFIYVASDGKLTSAPASVTITVQQVNHAPVADSKTIQTVQGQSVNILLSGSDPDGDNISFAIYVSPTNGSLSGTAPNLVYTPAPGFYGTDSFSFVVSDGQSTSYPATVTVNVSRLNNAPTAQNQAVQTNESQPLAITLTGTDPDGDTLTYSLLTAPSHGTLSGVAPNLTYTPAKSYTGPDSFTFSVNDGRVSSAPAVVSISVNALNGRVRVRRR